MKNKKSPQRERARYEISKIAKLGGDILFYIYHRARFADVLVSE